MSEILPRIDADQDLSEDTRVAALALVKALRREKELNEAAWAIAALPNQPRAQYELALHYLEDASAADPDNQESWSTRGLVHYRLGQPNEALDALARSQELLDRKMLALPAEDLTVRAMAQHQLGKDDEARTTLERVRSSASRDETEWQKLLAEVETLLGIPQAAYHPEQWVGRRFMPRRDARVELEDGSSYSPRRPFLITKLVNDRLWFGKNGKDSIARSQVVRIEDASRYYTNVLQAEPDSAAYRYRGEVSRVMGEYYQAIDDNSAAIGLEPYSPNSFHNRGLAKLLGKRDLDDALADVDRAIELIRSQNPFYAWYHVTRGIVRQEQGELDDALKSFDNAIELDPNFGWAYVKRAGAWSAKGDRAKVQLDLEEAIRRSPDDPETLAAKAWLLATSPNADHRDGEQAVDDAKKACELTVNRSPECLAALAAAYAETGDFDQAVTWQQEVITLLPPAARKDDESRLKHYSEHKAFYDFPKKPPAADAPKGNDIKQR